MTWLPEVPGEIYETSDGICTFEVVRIDDNKLWDWRREVCTYHEDHSWTAVDVVRRPDRIDA